MPALPEGITEEDVFLVMPELRDDPDIRAMVESMCRGDTAYKAAVRRFESYESERSLDCLTFHIYKIRLKIIAHFRRSVTDAITELRREGRVTIDPEILNTLAAECRANGISIQKKVSVTLK